MLQGNWLLLIDFLPFLARETAFFCLLFAFMQIEPRGLFSKEEFAVKESKFPNTIFKLIIALPAKGFFKITGKTCCKICIHLY